MPCFGSVAMRLFRLYGGDWIDVDLAAALGAGGEGSVYGVAGQPYMAVKLYSGGDPVRREQKLRAMRENAPVVCVPGSHTSIAWPQDLLSEFPRGPIVGYTMP